MPAYLLLGSEHGKKKEFIEKTAADFTKKSGRPFQTYRFYLDSDDTEAFFGALSNPSLFGDLQILIVSNAERLKGKPAKEAAALFKNLSDLTLLFFCSDETSAVMKLPRLNLIKPQCPFSTKSIRLFFGSCSSRINNRGFFRFFWRGRLKSLRRLFPSCSIRSPMIPRS